MKQAAFDWPVSRGGYHLASGPADAKGPGEGRPLCYVCPGRETGSPVQWRYDQPLAKPDRPVSGRRELFRVFAGLQLAPEAVLGFANQHGLLTCINPGDPIVPLPPYLPVPATLGGPGPTVSFGESLDLWFREIIDLREAVGLWDALNGVVPGLDQRFRWSADGRTVRYVETDQTVSDRQELGLEATLGDVLAAPPLADASVVFPAGPSDPRPPATVRLSQVIDDKLADRRIRVRTEIEMDDWTLHQALQPVNLLGAIWYQFLDLAFRGAGRRACEFCGQALPVLGASGTSRRRQRSDARFCSKRCQQNMNNRVKRESRGRA